MENQQNIHSLLKGKNNDLLDDLTFGLVNSMNFSNTRLSYPDFEELSPHEGVRPEWFYPVYRGTNGFSELNAINQYISQEAIFDEVGEMMLGIAMVEMKHLDKLGDFILKLNGSVSHKYETTYVAYGHTAEEAVLLGLALENNSIQEYSRLMEKMKGLPTNRTTEITIQFLSKLIADEYQHRAIFERWLLSRHISKF